MNSRGNSAQMKVIHSTVNYNQDPFLHTQHNPRHHPPSARPMVLKRGRFYPTGGTWPDLETLLSQLWGRRQVVTGTSWQRPRTLLNILWRHRTAPTTNNHSAKNTSSTEVETLAQTSVPILSKNAEQLDHRHNGGVKGPQDQGRTGTKTYRVSTHTCLVSVTLHRSSHLNLYPVKKSNLFSFYRSEACTEGG